MFSAGSPSDHLPHLSVGPPPTKDYILWSSLPQAPPPNSTPSPLHHPSPEQPYHTLHVISWPVLAPILVPVEPIYPHQPAHVPLIYPWAQVSPLLPLPLCPSHRSVLLMVEHVGVPLPEAPVVPPSSMEPLCPLAPCPPPPIVSLSTSPSSSPPNTSSTNVYSSSSSKTPGMLSRIALCASYQ